MQPADDKKLQTTGPVLYNEEKESSDLLTWQGWPVFLIIEK